MHLGRRWPPPAPRRTRQAQKSAATIDAATPGAVARATTTSEEQARQSKNRLQRGEAHPSADEVYRTGRGHRGMPSQGESLKEQKREADSDPVRYGRVPERR